MAYTVIRPTIMGTKVIFHSRFAWLANLRAEWYKLRYQWVEGVEVVHVATGVQEVIDICDHRQDLSDRLVQTLVRCEELESRCKELEMTPPVPDAVGALYALVARDADGRWTTVHDADAYVGDDNQAILDKVLA